MASVPDIRSVGAFVTRERNGITMKLNYALRTIPTVPGPVAHDSATAGFRTPNHTARTESPFSSGKVRASAAETKSIPCVRRRPIYFLMAIRQLTRERVRVKGNSTPNMWIP
jgi:hypothetical protein